MSDRIAPASADSHLEVRMTTSPVTKLHRKIRDERGAATAEYAVVTAAGAGLGGLLYKFLTSDLGEHLIKALFDMVLGMIGLK
jgi:hypothetical protein